MRYEPEPSPSINVVNPEYAATSPTTQALKRSLAAFGEGGAMKILLCLECMDLVALRRVRRSCACGLSAGFYGPDNLTAHIAGPAVCLGVDNESLERAIWDKAELGGDVWAFLIGRTSDRVVRYGAGLRSLPCGS